ncbi:MAG: phosphoribosylanthranilate isomerase, partial [Spirochaetaceae bacterium]|jgi:phosphoribosylanthranilate isomerase|nr:phosphoribosylanthranilate isomerase [Spirochaetaceae bacterium]
MKIKICGLFRKEDIDYVNEAEPDYAGFVFAKSRRQVDFNTAQRLSAGLNPKITPVGVFVDAPVDTIASLYMDGIIRAAQLHGNENEEYITKIKTYGIPVIKTVQCASNPIQTELASYNNADFLLFDSGCGSGERFDWSILNFTSSARQPWFLAGGIKQDTIDEAILLNPFCIDVSSGAESGGLKDREKIKNLVNRVRQA